MARSAAILIVDDDPAVLEALGCALKPPHEVLSAQNGVRALEIVGQRRLDLALIDYLLPDGSGLLLLRSIQRIAPSLPIILMTGFGSEDLAIESFRTGVRDYLKKPFTISELLSRLEKWLAKSSERGETVTGIGWPQGAGSREAYRVSNESLHRAIVFVEKHLNADVSLDRVANEAGMSKFHFCRVFKGATGLTLREFVARRRIAQAVELLKDGGRSVTDVSLEVGFKDMSHFGRVFRKLTGRLPSRFQRSHLEIEWEGRYRREPAPRGKGKGKGARRGE